MDVFISYGEYGGAHFAEHLKDGLERMGLSTFVARRDIRPWEKFKEVIDEAIDNCRKFVVILTPDACKSEYVMYEIERAITKKKSIIPCKQRQTSYEDIPKHVRERQMIKFDDKHDLFLNVWYYIRPPKLPVRRGVDYKLVVDKVYTNIDEKKVPTKREADYKLIKNYPLGDTEITYIPVKGKPRKLKCIIKGVLRHTRKISFGGYHALTVHIIVMLCPKCVKETSISHTFTVGRRDKHTGVPVYVTCKEGHIFALHKSLDWMLDKP